MGSHMLPMKELKPLFERCGCVDVTTYIRSGNVVFRSTDAIGGGLARRLADAVAKRYGFEPHVLVLTRSELEIAADGNPFPEAEANPKSLHVFFLASQPKDPDLAALEALRAPSERFALKGRAFYLHTPDGFGTSKLAGRAERLIGVPATARNWRTVRTLVEMARATAATPGR